MPKEMPKAYEPLKYENEIYKKWEKSGVFQPENLQNTKGFYCNVLPPPNSNGELHLGHVSGYVAMDLMGRYQRMLGKKVLLLPGKDHAGIQTQVVYEKKIKKERNINRHDLGRDKFYDEIYDFCIDRASYMRNQEKKIGLSADWNREKFTLDPKIVKQVLKTFVDMYNEVDDNGNRMIYRGERIINWCPRCASALADVEVEHEEQQTKLYYFRYDKNFPITIATTRAETKLGDTAVAVNPKDERYKKYIGKKYQADFCGIDLSIKIIADRNVDMEFGTGALGVTPAHSATDWQMAQENDLKIIKVINEEGKINKGFGEFSGKTVLAAREMIVKKLQEQGIIEREENFVNNLSVCERCKTAIEPLVSEQWFVNVDHKNFSLKKEARKAIESGKIKIYPERFKDVMFSWIDNVHDWCISRQIWWGPRIPAWYKCQKSDIGNQISDIYVGINKPEDKVSSFAEATAGKWVQDSDTFDTWFSSGQWAYTALGFPDSADFKEFYPSNTMIMGRDNLSFWAFRMVILSLYRTGKIPFKNLYFTGLIRDAKGKKMSKSKGNGIEPLDMIEKYGTDAMRLSMMIGSTPGNDMNLSEEKIAGFRNMVNKIWNISRYIITNYTRQASTSELSNTNEKINLENLTDVDRWMLAEFSTLTDAKVTSVTKFLNRYEFSLAATLLQVATLDFFADWYLEASKFEKNEEKEKILFYILKNILKLWHPFIPFVTEVIWQELNMKNDLIVSKWPKSEDFGMKRNDIENFEIIREMIVAIRNARSENKIEPARKIKAVIYAGKYVELVKRNEALIKGMRTSIQELEIKKSGKEIAGEIKVVAGDIVIYLIGAIDKEKEEARIKKEKINLEKQIKIIKNKLDNKNFVERAPEKIVEMEKDKLEKLKKEIGELGF